MTAFHHHHHPFFFSRYRAVASWSRVQGIGIPLITAIEIVSIWILSFILAIPEAIGFVMVPFEYKGEQHKTCMLNATSKFMEVRRVWRELIGGGEVFIYTLPSPRLIDISTMPSAVYSVISVTYSSAAWKVHIMGGFSFLNRTTVLCSLYSTIVDTTVVLHQTT